MTPPPATISGLRADRMISAARAITERSGSGRATCQVRSANSDSGQSNASACTSCGIATVAAPVSTGSVSTRIAPSSAAGSCSGRHTRSKYRDSGLNASLTVTSPRGRQLEFLQHRRADAGGEGVGGQQQHRAAG